ncbi:hypothetical protein BX266_0820 [Streptomyces sp. TLI_171]|nr:hypothetical protein BX266_0820 [Streptomyces sp. TLI_171]
MLSCNSAQSVIVFGFTQVGLGLVRRQEAFPLARYRK